METLLAAPVIVKILVSLSVILVVNKVSNNLLLSVVAGSLLLGFWSGHSAPRVGLIAWHQFVSVDNLILLLIVLLVIWLSSQMEKTGIMHDMVEAVRTRLSGRLSAALLPALIGLLPMPGGAIFSAPLVDKVDTEDSVKPLMKTRINYWFRHVWEYWWPLYPAVLLTIDISGLDIGQFVLVQFPLSLVMILGGYLFILRRVHLPPMDDEEPSNSFLRLVLPIIVIILCYVLLRLIVPVITSVSRYLPMAIGVAVAIIFIQIERPLPWKQLLRMAVTRKTISLVLIVSIIRIYGALIEARLPGGTFLMDQMKDELNMIGIPVLALIIVIPFISGFTTGIAVGFVGASMPIVIRLIGSSPPLGLLLSTVILAYGSGYLGVLFSPVHVCLLVTNEHFKTRLTQSLVGLIPAALFMYGFCLLFSFLIRYVGG
jgi:integral membrane protein (TIGR00529 family)